MGIEHVFVVYDPTTTNRFDLGSHKVATSIELTHYEVFTPIVVTLTVGAQAQDVDASNAAARLLAENDAAADNAAGDITDLAAAEAAARAAAAAAAAAQRAWEDAPQQDYGADAEDHGTGGTGYDADAADADALSDAAAAANAATAAAAAARALLIPQILSFEARAVGSSSPTTNFTGVTNVVFELLATYRNPTGYVGSNLIHSLQAPDGGFLTGGLVSGNTLQRSMLLGAQTYTLRVTNDNGTATTILTVTGTTAA